MRRIFGIALGVLLAWAPGQLSAEEAAALRAVSAVSDEPDGIVLTTREPAVVLSTLAGTGRLAGVRVTSGTLEDVFLDLTGREYRA